MDENAENSEDLVSLGSESFHSASEGKDSAGGEIAHGSQHIPDIEAS